MPTKTDNEKASCCRIEATTGGFQTVKKVRRPQKQYNAKKETVNFRFFLFELLKMRLALAWSVFCFLRRAPLTVSADKALRAPSFFRQDRAAIGIVTLRSPCVSMPRSGAAPLIRAVGRKSSIGNEKIFSFGKSKNAAIRGVWQEMRQTKRGNIPFPERCCPNRFVRTYRGALLAPAVFQTASERVKKHSFLTRTRAESFTLCPCAMMLS